MGEVHARGTATERQLLSGLAFAPINSAPDIFLASETLAEAGKLPPNFILITVEFVRSEEE
jgi:hypothetical protein